MLLRWPELTVLLAYCLGAFSLNTARAAFCWCGSRSGPPSWLAFLSSAVRVARFGMESEMEEELGGKMGLVVGDQWR